jgi:tetratricopeptide (TPR) repeat protein
MWTLLVLGLAAAWLYHQLSSAGSPPERSVIARRRQSPKLAQAIQYAERLWLEKRYIPAEKAYLQVIKLDPKNASAYTRLGMIYSLQKNYDDAKECFRIAARLEPSGAAFHNLGLACVESRNLVKAIASFEKAAMFEPTAERYTNLAKAYQKLANWNQAAATLEKVVELAPTTANLWMLASAYKSARNQTKAQEVYMRILQIDPADTKAKKALEPVNKVVR